MDSETLKRLAEGATPGPWVKNGYAIEGPFTPTGRESIGVVTHSKGRRTEADAALIVALVNGLPEIQAALRLGEVALRQKERMNAAALEWHTALSALRSSAHGGEGA